MKKPKFRAWAIAGVLLISLAGLGRARLQAAEIVVFAAASLTDALRDIGRNYEKLSGDQVTYNFGASSLLARQIEEGAPADIFFSADEPKMDALEKKDLVLSGTRTNRLANSLVIVVRRDSPLSIGSARDLTGSAVRRVALAEPTSVPAGIYARLYLTRQKLWPEIEKKVISTENVRAALAAVESGDVDAGIVYKTDVAIAKESRVALEIPPTEGLRIAYPVAMLKGAKNPEPSRRFLNHLLGKSAGEVFRKYGFIVPE